MRLNSNPNKKNSSTTFSHATRALWLRLPHHQATVHVIQDKTDKTPHVILNLSRGNSPGTLIDLTRLTHEELLAVRAAVLVATELAEPLVVEADRKAREAAEHGDDSDDRIYRGLPSLVVRPSILKFAPHCQGVLDRHADVFQGVGANVLPNRGVQPADSGVAGVLEGNQEAGTDDGPEEEG